MFEHSPTEVNEWKRMTLTGANIAVSIKDPRWQYRPGQRQVGSSLKTHGNATN